MIFKLITSSLIFSFPLTVRNFGATYLVLFNIFLPVTLFGNSELSHLSSKNISPLKTIEISNTSSLDLLTPQKKEGHEAPSDIQTNPPLKEDQNATSSSIQNFPTTDQDPEKVSQFQKFSQHRDRTPAQISKQHPSFKKEIRAFVSLYDHLVAQAEISKQRWNNTGSISALASYNTIAHQIKLINEHLQRMGGYTLPDLPFLMRSQQEKSSNNSFP